MADEVGCGIGSVGGSHTVHRDLLPVARGSPILRSIDVPFEQTARYHRWIGNLRILLVTIQGELFATYAGSTNQLSLHW